LKSKGKQLKKKKKKHDRVKRCHFDTNTDRVKEQFEKREKIRERPANFSDQQSMKEILGKQASMGIKETKLKAYSRRDIKNKINKKIKNPLEKIR